MLGHALRPYAQGRRTPSKGSSLKTPLACSLLVFWVLALIFFHSVGRTSATLRSCNSLGRISESALPSIRMRVRTCANWKLVLGALTALPVLFEGSWIR